MVPHGAANQAAILDPSVFLRKPSPTRVYLHRLAPHPCGDQEACQVNGSENEWQVRMRGAFTIPCGVLGLKETDESCHHEVWIHLLHVNVRLVDRVSRDDNSRRPNSRKRNSPYGHSKEKRQHR